MFVGNGLERCATLSEVLEWCWRGGVEVSAVRLVEQDEFDRDLIVPLGDGRHAVVAAT